MRERKNKRNLKQPDDSNVAVLKCQIGQLVDEINTKQAELDNLANTVNKTKLEVQDNLADLEKIRQSIFDNQKKFDADKVTHIKQLKSMQLDAENDILNRLDKCKAKEDKLAEHEASTEEIFDKANKQIQSRLLNIVEQEKLIKNRLEELERAEKSFILLKDKSLKEQEIAKKMYAKVKEEEECLAQKETKYESDTLDLEKKNDIYDHKVRQLESDVKAFEHDKNNILQLQANVKAIKDGLEAKIANLDAREGNIIVKEKVIAIDRDELNKLKQDLQKIQRKVLNANV